MVLVSKKRLEKRRKNITGRTWSYLIRAELKVSHHCGWKETWSHVNKKHEVVEVSSARSNGPQKPLRGSYLRREELSRTFQPRSGLWPSAFDLSLAPAALGLTDCSLITDHQAQWTINLKQETPSRATVASFLLKQKFFINVFHEQAHARNWA